MKKFLLLCASSLLVSIPMSALCDPFFFDGFYAGAQGGFLNSSITDHQTLHVDLPVPNITSNYSPNTTSDSVTGGVHAGYSKLIHDRLVLGLETRASFEDLDTNFDTNTQEANTNLSLSSHTSVDLNYDFSLLGKIGLVLGQQTLLYGLIGPQEGNFNLSSSATYNQTIPPNFHGNASVSKNESEFEGGILFGFGMEHYVTNNFSLSMEYNHSNYGNLDFPDQSTVINTHSDETGTFTATNNIEAQTNSVLLKLDYYLF